MFHITLIEKQMIKSCTYTFIILSLVSTAIALHAWPFFSRTPERAIPLAGRTRFTIMIDPAGDARNPGRNIDASSECNISMACAEALKKELEQKLPGLRVIFTRVAGETIAPLQNASFANRLQGDLYLSLHFFHQKEKVPRLFIYRLLYNPSTDIWDLNNNELSLLPYNHVYRLHLKKTKSLSAHLYMLCEQEAKARTIPLVCMPPLSIPYKPLVGITAQAIGIELGMRKPDDWKKIIPILVAAFKNLIRGNTL